jgi:hypothetical protein
MWGWLVALLAPLLEKISLDLVKDFISWLSSLWAKHEKTVVEERQASDYKKVIADPNATPEDKKNAEDKLLNS